MPTAIAWTEAMDARLLDLRRAGTHWNRVALALKISRNTVIERARHLGMAAHAKPVQPAPVESKAQDRGDDVPLRAGHPISWGMLAMLTPSIDAAWPN